MRNKILLSLLFVVFFILLISIFDTVSASSSTFDYNDKTYEYPTNYFFNYSVIVYWYTDDNGNCVFLAFSSNKAFYCKNVDVVGENILHVPPDTSFNKIILRYDNENTDVSSPSVTVYNKSSGSSEVYLSTDVATFGALRVKQLEERCVYCSHDICNVDGSVLFSSTVEVVDLNLTVTPDYDTKNVPVKISTDFYSLKVFEDILVQYSTNQKDWETCKWGRITDSNSSNNGKYNFYLDVYRNGTYYFRLWNAADNTYIYKTVVISNIVYSPDDVNNYVNGVFDPTPFLTYEYINDNKINIITQKFFIDQIIDLQCFYAKDISKEDYNNKQKWTKVEARTMIDQLTQRDVYQFCFEVDNGSFGADGTYTVCFYNVFLDKYTYSEIVIDFDEILKVDGSMIWKYVHFFKERFGFLIYPFDLTINTLKRIASIDYGEPKFNIPDIYEPTTNKKLISAVTFNFNDYLENNTFKTVHNTYLIIVDAVIIFGLLNLAWKKISGVFK